MGRKKRVRVEEFPFLPVPMADFVLYNESAIRAAVREARESLSFVSASKLDGSAAGGRVSDRTAAAALTLAEGLGCVVLDDGVTVQNPEEWLSCLDAVREKARACNRPDLIYDIWDFRYKERGLFFGETMEKCLPVETMPGGVVSWIRYHVLVEARQRGLVSFSDVDIEKEVRAAAG